MAGKFFPVLSCGKAAVMCIFLFWLKPQETKLETDAKGDCDMCRQILLIVLHSNIITAKLHLVFFSPLPDGEVHWKVHCVPLSNI